MQIHRRWQKHTRPQPFNHFRKAALDRVAVHLVQIQQPQFLDNHFSKLLFIGGHCVRRRIHRLPFPAKDPGRNPKVVRGDESWREQFGRQNPGPVTRPLVDLRLEAAQLVDPCLHRRYGLPLRACIYKGFGLRSDRVLIAGGVDQSLLGRGFQDALDQRLQLFFVVDTGLEKHCLAHQQKKVLHFAAFIHFPAHVPKRVHHRAERLIVHLVEASNGSFPLSPDVICKKQRAIGNGAQLRLLEISVVALHQASEIANLRLQVVAGKTQHRLGILAVVPRPARPSHDVVKLI